MIASREMIPKEILVGVDLLLIKHKACQNSSAGGGSNVTGHFRFVFQILEVKKNICLLVA